MLKKSILIGIFSILALSSIGTKAQTVDTTNNQELLNLWENYKLTNPISTSMQMPISTNATSSSEDITYTKKTVVNNNTNVVQKTSPDKEVFLDDILGVNITSRYSPNTPIEIFVLTYKKDITKKISIKTVYNEFTNVLKTYRLTVGQELIEDMGDIDYFKIGFCVNGCRLIPTKMILSR